MNGEDNLKAPVAQLADAEREVKKAEHDIAETRCDIETAIEDEKHRHEFEVTVIYNGVPKEFDVRRDELVQRLLERAKQAFGPIPNAHLLGLFTTAGVELQDSQTIEAAGVKPREKLLLRPSSVRGG